MKIKAEILESGPKHQEEIRCPQCGHLNNICFTFDNLEGKRRCWYCDALLKWKAVEVAFIISGIGSLSLKWIIYEIIQVERGE